MSVHLIWTFSVHQHILHYPLILEADNEGPDQPVQMHRLIRACIVHKLHKGPFCALCIKCSPRQAVPARFCIFCYNTECAVATDYFLRFSYDTDCTDATNCTDSDKIMLVRSTISLTQSNICTKTKIIAIQQDQLICD